MWRSRLFTLAMLVVGFIQTGWPAAAQAQPQARIITEKISPDVRTALLAGKPQEVIIEFDDSAIQTNASAMRRKAGQQHETAPVMNFKKTAYQKLKAATVAPMSANSVDTLIEYSHLPMTFMRVKSVAALDTLLADPRVRQVHKNGLKYPVLDAVSSNFVNQPAAATRGFTGAGGSVAIIDTGANYTLSDFGSCTAPGVPSGCKVSFYHNYAGGSSLDANGHGSNVAGIVAGVAPDSKMRVLNVFGSNSSTSDALIIQAINDTIAAKATVNILAINLSLGDSVNHGSGFGADCTNSSFYTPIFNALQANIQVVVASGNNGFSNGVSSPACTPGALAVGAVYDMSFGSVQYSICTDTAPNADQIACFTNLPPLSGSNTFNNAYKFVTAPGVNITAAGIADSGTSQATPFAAAAVAIHNAALVPLTAAQISRGDQIGNFMSVPCGPSIPVARTGYSTLVTRVDVSACLLDANDSFANATSFGTLASNATANGDNVFATKEAGEPNHAGNAGGHSVWFTLTAADTAPIEIDTHLSGFPTVLAVYTGSTVGALSQVAANVTDGSAGSTSGLTFPAVAGSTYQIALDGYNGAHGNWDLNINILASNLSVTLVANAVPNNPEAIQYVATVTNPGPATATNVKIHVQLPAGVTLDPNNTGGCTAGTGNVVICTIGTINAPAGSASVSFNGIGSTTGIYTATASVTSDYVDPAGTSSATASGSITGVAANIPTIPEWGMGILGCLLLGLVFRRCQAAQSH